MHGPRKRLYFVVLAPLVLITTARADWNDWWRGSRSQPAAQSPDDERSGSHGGFSFGAPSQTAPSSGGNVFQRLGSGTRKLFSRSKESMSGSKPAAKQVKDKPFRGWTPNSGRKSQKPAKSSTWSRWFGPKEEPGPSKTFDEFFSSERP